MSRAVVTCTWDEVPHLTKEVKDDLFNTVVRLHPHQADARTKGVPSLGVGAIYPFSDETIKVDPFELPKHWPRAFALDADAGSGWTAIVWAALDREAQKVFIYDCYKSASRELALHIEALRQRGLWIPGVADARNLLVTEYDSQQVIQLYKQAGVDVEQADKAIEAGLAGVYELLVPQRLKVFSTCTAWFKEKNLYRRNEKGAIVKKDDHLMDACVAGETKVVTSQGLVPIRDLVGTTGVVLSRDGAWARYIGARQTMLNSPVVRLSFVDGTSVVCTPDHPFLTPDGWVRADQMGNVECYNAAWQRAMLTSLCLRLTKSFKAAGITVFTGATMLASRFIARYGKRLTVPFRKAWTSITETRIRPIMPSTTLSYSLVGSTSAIIVVENHTAGQFLKRLGLRLRRGTVVRLAASGIGSSMPRLASAPSINSVNFRVISAERRTRDGSLGRTASVARSAVCAGIVLAALTMRNALARRAAASLWCIATRLQKRAAGSAVVRCRSVEPFGTAPVYCLTVPGLHSFAIESGLVVHNTRYLIRNGLKRAKIFVEPKPKGQSFFVVDQGQQGTGWMS